MKETTFLRMALYFVFALGLVFGLVIATKHVRKQAISHGHAIYNPTNGEFMWREKE